MQNGADKMAKMAKNVGLNQDSNQGPSREKKVSFFCFFFFAKFLIDIRNLSCQKL